VSSPLVITNFILKRVCLELKAEKDRFINICVEDFDVQLVEDMRRPIEENILQIRMGRILSNSSIVPKSQPIRVAETAEKNELEFSWFNLYPLERRKRSTLSSPFKFIMIQRTPVPPLPEYGLEVYLRLLQLDIVLHAKEVQWISTTLIDTLSEALSKSPSDLGDFSLYRVRRSKQGLDNMEADTFILPEPSSQVVFNTFKADIHIDGPSIQYKTRGNGPRLEVDLEKILIRADAGLGPPKIAKDYVLCDERQVEFPSLAGDFNSIKAKMGQGIQVTRVLGSISPILIYYRHHPSRDRECILSFDEIPFAIDWDNSSSPQFQCALYVNDVR
jgi:hypothetical protein